MHNDQMVTSLSRLGDVTIESASHKTGLACIFNHKNGIVTNEIITNPDEKKVKAFQFLPVMSGRDRRTTSERRPV
jgi:hypothetical protein